MRSQRLERAILDISYDIMGSLENGISSSLIMLGGGIDSRGITAYNTVRENNKIMINKANEQKNKRGTQRVNKQFGLFGRT